MIQYLLILLVVLMVESLYFLIKILSKLEGIKKQEVLDMRTLDEVLIKVTDNGMKIWSLSLLTAGIKAQLDAVLAGELTPEAQAKVDNIFAALEANGAAIVETIEANTIPIPQNHLLHRNSK